MPKRASRRDYPPPPEFFLDRGLGKHVVANALRELGHTVYPMDDVFGDDPRWRKDEIWLPEVARRGWVIVMKDDAIRRKPLQRTALMRAKARAFCITNSQITGPQMAERLTANAPKIARLSRKPGPYVYGVYDDDVVRLFPADPSRLRRH